MQGVPIGYCISTRVNTATRMLFVYENKGEQRGKRRQSVHVGQRSCL